MKMGCVLQLALTPEMEKYGWGFAISGILLVSLSLLLRLRKKMRAGNQRVTARENLERYKAKTEVRDDLSRVMVEVEQMARRVAAQLDAKTIAVEKLLAEADERIARLEALQHTTPTGAPPDIPPAPQADTMPPAKTPARATPAADSSPTTPADELSAKVYALADDGLNPSDIARKLQEHIGKVELILALRSA